MEYKVCIKCNLEKSLDCYAEKRTVCKSCRSAQVMARYHKKDKAQVKAKRDKYLEDNREHINQVAKEWKLKNPDKVKAARVRHYDANREAINAEVMRKYYDNPQVFSEKAAAYYQRNREQVKRRVSEYYSLNREEISVKAKVWRQVNKLQKAASDLRWARNNRDRVLASQAKRRALKLKATPVWANHDKIRSFYSSSDALNMLLGEWHHVDHVVPLQSKYVCGLHCEANLQILTASQNISKGNRYWPDMWEQGEW